MIGITTNVTTDTNQLKINIPDELKGIELQIIILPASKDNTQIEFFTEAELQQLPSVNLGTVINDTEEYSKW